jgi:hypothetical protein
MNNKESLTQVHFMLKPAGMPRCYSRIPGITVKWTENDDLFHVKGSLTDHVRFYLSFFAGSFGFFADF